MRNLNALNLAQAQSEIPWPVDFVKINISSNEILRLCNHHHHIDRGVNIFNFDLDIENNSVAGDILTVTLDGTAFSFTLVEGSSLSPITTALSTAIGNDPRYTISNLQDSMGTFTITGTDPENLTSLSFSDTSAETAFDRYVGKFTEVSDGGRYFATGSFLGFGDISDELEIKNNSLDISLSGVDPSFTAIFLQNNVEGSLVQVSRGYYDEAIGNIVAAPEPRWAGRVNNASIQDDYNFTDEDKIVISVQCKSLFESLFKRQSGRYTSLQGFQKLDSDDLSMEFMASIALFTPSFGKDN